MKILRIFRQSKMLADYLTGIAVVFMALIIAALQSRIASVLLYLEMLTIIFAAMSRYRHARSHGH